MKKFSLAVMCALALGLGFSGVVHAGDKEMCEKYQARLKKYETEGVMGINPSTGEKKKMEGQAAKDAIDDTKENIKIFCK